jgi:hypothetical protein
MLLYMRRIILTLILTITLLSGKGQLTSTQGHQFQFPQVGWKIKVPSDFTILDSAQVAAMDNFGASAMNNTYDTTTDFGTTKTLISFNKGQYNFFSSTITPFDPARDGDWNEVNSKLKNVILGTLRNQAEAIKVDTSSSDELIDGLEFHKFQIITTYQSKLVMKTLMYRRLHMGFDYGINISYTDENVGQELQLILASSKFDK